MSEADILKDPSFTGAIIMSLDGTVESTTGEFSSNGDQVARTIYSMLQDANLLISASRKPDPFKRLSVTFDDHVFVATISNNKVYVVKKPVL